MSSIYRLREVTLKSSPHFGKVERWEPRIEHGSFILARRYPKMRPNTLPNSFG